MNAADAWEQVLRAVPAAAVTAVVLVVAVAWAVFALCRGLALLLPQDSADRRTVALRKAELHHDRWCARRR